MVNEWPEVALSDCAELIKDIIDPSTVSSLPYVGLEHIGMGSLSLVGFGLAGDTNSQKALFKRGDILFGKLRPYFRKVTVAPFDGVCSTDIWVVRAKQGFDQKYVFYRMASQSFIEEASRASEGTRMPRAKWEFVSKLAKPTPELSEQRRIAEILGSLDDKIELNRRMNRTLEEMAQVIFKSWFVDFDPVHAKAAGRDTGLPKHIADLFPDSFEKSELGLIPKGWTVETIDHVADIIGGGTPSTKNPEYWDGGRNCWATPKDLSNLEFPILLNTERMITDQGLSQISSRLLPAGTVLMSSRAPIGYFALAEVPTAINQGFIAMKPKERVSSEFLLLWARNAQSEILCRANGSTFQEISKTNFRNISVIVPSDNTLKAFDACVAPLYRRIVKAVSETATLINIRDALLPKLMSGMIDLPRRSYNGKA